jgi:hypothetical protein
MADPLSITASIIAILQLSQAVTIYLKDIPGGSKDRLILGDEIRNTVCLLEMLKDRVEDAELQETWGQSIASLGAPHGPLAQFSETLEVLVTKLSPARRLRQISQAFKWPFDKCDITIILDRLERQKSLFSLALKCDHM